jgi:hypothetical protein
MIALLLASAAAIAVPTDTKACATIAPVSTSVDLAGLQRDADCFGAALISDKAARDILSKAITSATSSQKLRLDRIAYVKAHPPVPPASTGWIASPSLAGLPPIASEFDPMAQLVPSWFKGPAPSMAPDNVGAFRFICGPGQLNNDDPIVYPGQPGKSHLHQYYGNTAVNANSTYESLRTSGQTTCGNPLLNPLNRSGYWMPAMFDGKGNVVRPRYVGVYYKRRPASDPFCHSNGAIDCLALPNGLRFIFGRNMLNLAEKMPPLTTQWSCTTPSGGAVPNGAGPTGAGYADLASVAKGCAVGQVINAAINAPGCWDGKHLDSPDHRSHVAHVEWSTGVERCPPGFPYIIPSFRLAAAFPVMAGDDPTLWRLSSDVMAPDEPAGSTFHADWFGAWDPIILAIWTKECLDKMLSSTGGDLCQGQMMPGAAMPAESAHLVPIPSRGM